MNQFEYVRPATLENALSLLAAQEEAKPLAGGMSLLSAMKLRLSAPVQLVDLSGIESLKGITATQNELVIGAMTRHADVAASGAVKQRIPGLAELAGGIGDRQVRNRGAIGGSLANSDPAACYPAGVTGLGATIVTNRRQIPVDEFFLGLFETALEPGELITAVRFPVPKMSAYMKFHQPASRFAIVGVMVSVGYDDTVRVGVTGAKVCAFRATEIEQALQREFSAAAAMRVALQADEMNTDMHADAEYRARLVSVMAARAVEKCLQAR
jgi:carbon-monoxide dehydrogenase medium subunit